MTGATNCVARKYEDSLNGAEVIALVAHELRTPISAIRCAVSAMESVEGSPATTDRARRVIAKQIGQLSVLVEDLLDFASLARGTFKVRRDQVDVVPIIEAAVEACSLALSAGGHTICVRMPTAPVNAFADAARLHQVVSNLLENANKYTPPMGRICIALEQVAGEVVLSVQDNGVGISGNRLPHVFELFRRYPESDSRQSSAKGAQGLGIGLALVRAIVEQHDGTVEARSPGPGRGSQFIVRLPVCCSPADA